MNIKQAVLTGAAVGLALIVGISVGAAGDDKTVVQTPAVCVESLDNYERAIEAFSIEHEAIGEAAALAEDSGDMVQFVDDLAVAVDTAASSLPDMEATRSAADQCKAQS